MLHRTANIPLLPFRCEYGQGVSVPAPASSNGGERRLARHLILRVVVGGQFVKPYALLPVFLYNTFPVNDCGLLVYISSSAIHLSALIRIFV
jgi:hypothetical protein